MARLGLWLYSAAALPLLAYVLWIGPISPWVALAAAVGYVAYSTLGVLFPELEMFGRVLWRGPKNGRQVALTFDDGPHPETTRRVLEILKAGGHVATFFVVGEKAEAHPEVLREIVAAGHGVGLHGYTHDRLYSLRSPKRVHADIRRSQDAIERICGVRPRLFRPPVGFASHRTLAGAKRAEVTVVGASARSLDGIGGGRPDHVAARLIRALVPGALILLHDAAERDDFVPASIAALPELLGAIDARGLETVRLDAWLQT